MLSVNLIGKFIRASQYDQLLGCLSANGLDLPMGLRVRLSQSPAAAIALGLRRLVELTYAPTDSSRRLTEQLLSLQDEDGLFENDPLATACAAAALRRLVADHYAGPEVGQAHERAIGALARMQHLNGCEAGFPSPLDRREDDRALVAAFMLYLLTDDPLFRNSVRLGDMFGWFERREQDLDDATLRFFDLARGRGGAPVNIRETVRDLRGLGIHCPPQSRSMPQTPIGHPREDENFFDSRDILDALVQFDIGENPAREADSRFPGCLDVGGNPPGHRPLQKGLKGGPETLGAYPVEETPNLRVDAMKAGRAVSSFLAPGPPSDDFQILFGGSPQSGQAGHLSLMAVGCESQRFRGGRIEVPH